MSYVNTRKCSVPQIKSRNAAASRCRVPEFSCISAYLQCTPEVVTEDKHLLKEMWECCLFRASAP